jgi:hypothetical protein
MGARSAWRPSSRSSGPRSLSVCGTSRAASASGAPIPRTAKAAAALTAARSPSVQPIPASEAARSTATPPATPASAPAPVIRDTKRLAVWGSKRSVTTDQKPESRSGPSTVTCR